MMISSGKSLNIRRKFLSIITANKHHFSIINFMMMLLALCRLYLVKISIMASSRRLLLSVLSSNFYSKKRISLWLSLHFIDCRRIYRIDMKHWESVTNLSVFSLYFTKYCRLQWIMRRTLRAAYHCARKSEFSKWV